MKQKTAWKVTVDSQAVSSKNYLVTAGTADMAAKRAVSLAKKEKDSPFIGAPYAQVVECKGTVYVFE